MAHTIEAHQFAARDFIGGDAALDDMAVCGNVAKAERFYARTRKKVRG